MTVQVSGRGVVSAPPARLRVDGGPWLAIVRAHPIAPVTFHHALLADGEHPRLTAVVPDAGWFTGSLWLVAVTATCIVAATRIRSRLLPTWRGSPARLAESIIALGTLIGVSQALGAAGAFRLPWLLAGLTSVAVGAAVAGRRSQGPSAGSRRPAADVGGRPGAYAALIAVAAAVGTWSTYTFESLRHGILAADSIWYHLPRAAHFAETGWVTRLHYTAPEFPDTFHPSNAELIQSVPMVTYGFDAMAPVINLGWLALLCLAAWCVGQPSGRGTLSLTVVASLLATPLLVIEGAGNAGNDIAAAFFLLGAVAMLVQRDAGLAAVAIAGTSAGLGMSTKLTVVPAVVALTLGVVLGGSTDRLRRLAAWVLPLVGFGSYWYIRNWVMVGSPVPATDLPLFPAAEFRVVEETGYSVADYLGDGTVWRDWFLPGLRADFGLAWFLVLASLAVASALCLRDRRSRMHQAVGLALGISAVVYVVLPTSALGPLGQPWLFAGNVIYLAPALLLGLAVLPTVLSQRSPLARWGVLGVAAAVLISGATTSSLPVTAEDFRMHGAVAAAAILAGGAWLFVRRPSTRSLQLGALAIALLAIVLGLRTSERYFADAYTSQPFYRWARNVTGARIAIAGFAGQYPFYGAELDNEVVYLGQRGRRGAFHDITACTVWRSALRSGRVDHVVLRSERSEIDGALQWTRSDPAATLFLESSGGTVFRFDPDVADPGCN